MLADRIEVAFQVADDAADALARLSRVLDLSQGRVLRCALLELADAVSEGLQPAQIAGLKDSPPTKARTYRLPADALEALRRVRIWWDNPPRTFAVRAAIFHLYGRSQVARLTLRIIADEIPQKRN